MGASMSLENPNARIFLEELYSSTKGDPQALVSMYEIGTGIGLAKGEAGALAEELMVSGLVELRTLAGGISITSEGLATLGIASPVPAAGAQQQLSQGPDASKEDCRLLISLIDTVKARLPELQLEYSLLEEIIIDCKSIEVQLLSPRPKIAVFRELLRSLHTALQRDSPLSAQLAALIR